MSLKDDTAISTSDITPGMPSAVSADSSAPPREARALLTHRLLGGVVGEAVAAAEEEGRVAAQEGPMLMDAPADAAMHTQVSAALRRLFLRLLPPPRLISRSPDIVVCG